MAAGVGETTGKQGDDMIEDGMLLATTTSRQAKAIFQDLRLTHRQLLLQRYPLPRALALAERKPGRAWLCLLLAASLGLGDAPSLSDRPSAHRDPDARKDHRVGLGHDHNFERTHDGMRLQIRPWDYRLIEILPGEKTTRNR